MKPPFCFCRMTFLVAVIAQLLVSPLWSQTSWQYGTTAITAAPSGASVGIGTANPLASLHVAGSGVTPIVEETTPNGGAYFQFYSQGSRKGYFGLPGASRLEMAAEAGYPL